MFSWFKKKKTSIQSEMDPSFEWSASENSYLTPLGVCPFRDGRPVKTDLTNGYLREEIHNAAHEADYLLSLSTDLIQPLVNAIVTRLFPGQCYAVLEWTTTSSAGTQEDHTYLTHYARKETFETILAPYMFRLLNDGFVGFGFAWSDGKVMEEVFVNFKKVVRISTVQQQQVEEILQELSIPPFETPRFITNYPTLNTDLMGLAGFLPQEFGQYDSIEYFSGHYVPELIERMGFRQDLLKNPPSSPVVNN